MNRKKRELYTDLPPRSDPEYMKLYRQKNKEHLKKLGKDWLEKQLEKNPDFYKERYNQNYQLEYYKKNIKKLSENSWKRYGIENMTYELYLEELKKQKGLCKLCNKEMKKPQVDHDHKTGKYRSLLCVPCNNGLGVYENKKHFFEQYLKEHENDGRNCTIL